MHIALKDLNLQHLGVVYPGKQKYSLHEKITTVPLKSILQILRDLLRV